jgi:hypothetical protein
LLPAAGQIVRPTVRGDDPPVCDHRHVEIDIPADYVDPAGRPVDHCLLGQFVSAVFDGCGSCGEALLVLLSEDLVTTARLVELACISTRDVIGGLPDNLTDTRAPSAIAADFRALAHTGLDGGNVAMFEQCARMNLPQRCAAAASAAALLISQLSLGL